QFHSLYGDVEEDHKFADGGHVFVTDRGEVVISWDGDGGHEIFGEPVAREARRISRNLDWAADAASESDDYEDAEESPNGLVGWTVDGKGALVGFGRGESVRFGWPNGDGTYGTTDATGTYNEVEMTPREARQMSVALARAADTADSMNAPPEE